MREDWRRDPGSAVVVSSSSTRNEAAGSFRCRRGVPCESSEKILQALPDGQLGDEDRRHAQDLIIESMDLALRVGKLRDSDMVHAALDVGQSPWPPRPTTSTPWVGRRHPATWRAIGLSATRSIATIRAAFVEASRPESIRLTSRLSISLNEVRVVAAVAGLGIIDTGILALHGQLGNGRLAWVLPDWDAGGFEVRAVSPSRRAVKASARAFAKFLAHEMTDLT